METDLRPSADIFFCLVHSYICYQQKTIIYRAAVGLSVGGGSDVITELNVNTQDSVSHVTQCFDQFIVAGERYHLAFFIYRISHTTETCTKTYRPIVCRSCPGPAYIVRFRNGKKGKKK